jgi:basic membrane lipoprotein Med (substrate-binding protein (PBP1-ABC) superfamily)
MNYLEQENPFKQKKRRFPVELEHPYSDNKTILINLSPVDTATVIPQNLSLVLQYGGIQFGKFTYKIGYERNSIRVSIRWDMYKSIIPAEYYDFLKEFTAKAIAKLNEPIIIERK